MLIMGEGRHDVWFFQDVLGRVDRAYNIQSFYAEDIDDQNRHRSAESKKIRSLDDPHNYHFDTLIKSENGIDDLKDIVSSLLLQLPRIEEKVIQFDADHRPIEAFFDDLRERIHGRHPGNPLTLEIERITQDQTDLTVVDTSLSQHGDEIDHIPFISFHPDLEEITGIEDEDREEECKDKIQAYLDEHDSAMQTLRNVFEEVT